jgi:hypothetical protein
MIEYLDPIAGPITKHKDREAAQKYADSIDEAIKLLQFQGYKILDHYGREIAKL